MPAKKTKRRSIKAYKKRIRRNRMILLFLLVLSISFITYLVQRHQESKLSGNFNNNLNLTATTFPSKTNNNIEERHTNSDSRDVATITPNIPVTPNPNGEDKDPKKETFVTNLYFPDELYINLKRESVVLTYESTTDINIEKKIEMTINELLKGPRDKSNRTVIPQGVELISVSVLGTTATLNFSNNFISDHLTSSLTVRLLLGQLVLTCGEFAINEISILIKGESIENYPGEVDLSLKIKKTDYINLIF